MIFLDYGFEMVYHDIMTMMKMIRYQIVLVTKRTPGRRADAEPMPKPRSPGHCIQPRGGEPCAAIDVQASLGGHLYLILAELRGSRKAVSMYELHKVD